MSTRYNEPVWDNHRSPITHQHLLRRVTLILTYLVCIPLGIYKGIKHAGTFDHASAIVFIGYAVPGYIVGIALLTALASESEIFPLGGFVSDDFEDMDFWSRSVTSFGTVYCPDQLHGGIVCRDDLYGQEQLDGQFRGLRQNGLRAKGAQFWGRGLAPCPA